MDRSREEASGVVVISCYMLFNRGSGVMQDQRHSSEGALQWEMHQEAFDSSEQPRNRRSASRAYEKTRRQRRLVVNAAAAPENCVETGSIRDRGC